MAAEAGGTQSKSLHMDVYTSTVCKLPLQSLEPTGHNLRRFNRSTCCLWVGKASCVRLENLTQDLRVTHNLAE